MSQQSVESGGGSGAGGGGICPAGQHQFFVLVSEIMDVPNPNSLADSKEPPLKTIIVTRQLACCKCPATMKVQA